MKSIRRTGSALVAAAALSLPSLVLAEEAPSALCDGMKKEDKAPTAETSKQETDKSAPQKKNESERESKEKPDQSQARRTS